LSHWTIDTGEDYISVNSDAAHSGNYGLEISGMEDTIYSELYSDWFDVTNIDTITLWYKTPKLVGNLSFYIYLYDGNNFYELSEMNEEASEWTQLTLDVSLYSGKYKFWIYVHFYGEGEVS
jgi:hypothetical protein